MQASPPADGKKVVRKLASTASKKSSQISGDVLIQAAVRDATASGRVLNQAVRGSNPIDYPRLAPGRLPVRTVRLFQGMRFRASGIDTVIDDSSH